MDRAITLFFQPSKGEPEMAKEILIADSDTSDREEFQNIFKATNYNLVFSESGEQASLRVKLFKPDLIILGASLHGKSGLEVFKEIKAEVESKHIPIIFLSNIFKEFSEEDQKRVQADGVITKPFHGDEILNLFDRLIGGEEMQSKDEKILGREMEWKSIADIEKIPSKEKKESLLDQTGEEEQEEIIDLVDIAEEPDIKMSINDFVVPEKEEPYAGITPLESWEKLMEEEKPADKSFKFAPYEKERDAKSFSLQLDEDSFSKSQTSNKELLNKIELEEILQKMEQMVPSIEKELPSEIKLDVKPEVKQQVPEPALPIIEEPSEKFAGLAEFEAALKKGMGAETTEEEVPSLQFEKPKKEPTEEYILKDISWEEKRFPGVPKEKAPESLLEGFAEEDVALIKEPEKERVETLKEKETLEAEEELRIFGDSLKERSEILEEAPKISREEVRIFKEPEEERIDLLEEEGPEAEEKLRIFGDSMKELSEIFEEAPKISREEVRIFKEPEEEGIELLEEKAPGAEEEEIRILGESMKEMRKIFEGAPEILKGEVEIFDEPEKERVEMFEDAEASELIAPIVQEKEVMLPSREVDRQMEEVISKGVREMTEGFITKLIPEITQSIINLTIKRIEQMVKEIIPELAEKMIREEIKRLQKEEKD
jgi:DNA-binding response OmpR family regulator